MWLHGVGRRADEDCPDGKAERRGFKLASQRGGKFLRLSHKEDDTPEAKIHGSQWRLRQKIGKSLFRLGFPSAFHKCMNKHDFYCEK